MSIDSYQPVEDAFRDGTIESQDSETLARFLLALANKPIPNESVRHRDIIRGLTINHMLLQRHNKSLSDSNTRLSWFVAILTIVATATGIAQMWYANKADVRAEAEERRAEAKEMTQRTAATPVPGSLPASRPASAAASSATK